MLSDKVLYFLHVKVILPFELNKKLNLVLWQLNTFIAKRVPTMLYSPRQEIYSNALLFSSETFQSNIVKTVLYILKTKTHLGSKLSTLYRIVFSFIRPTTGCWPEGQAKRRKKCNHTGKKLPYLSWWNLVENPGTTVIRKVRYSHSC